MHATSGLARSDHDIEASAGGELQRRGTLRERTGNGGSSPTPNDGSGASSAPEWYMPAEPMSGTCQRSRCGPASYRREWEKVPSQGGGLPGPAPATRYSKGCPPTRVGFTKAVVTQARACARLVVANPPRAPGLPPRLGNAAVGTDLARVRDIQYGSSVRSAILACQRSRREVGGRECNRVSCSTSQSARRRGLQLILVKNPSEPGAHAWGEN